MKDIIKNVTYNNPSLLPIGNYDIEIRRNLMIELKNSGSFGKNKGNYHIINTYNVSDKDILFIDMVTLKKVLDMEKKYPKMDKDEVMTICQMRLTGDVLEINGDVVKVNDNMK